MHMFHRFDPCPDSDSTLCNSSIVFPWCEIQQKYLNFQKKNWEE